MNEVTLYAVGDSTLSEFKDVSYYYPRYGYATQLFNYFENINIVNLALSGRSSKSYIYEKNYTKLKCLLKKGDYLLIGFGHNDSKDDDAYRYTNATGGLDDQKSFKFHLYEYYIKLALSLGATPILATPIVRLSKNDDFSGLEGHITPNGDYKKAILELASELNVTAIDLTTLTKDLFMSLGYLESIYHHAMTSSFKESFDAARIVDKAHLNIYGAKYVAYLFAKGISETNCSLKEYLVSQLIEPTKEDDLISNPDYIEIDYKAPDLVNYQPIKRFKCYSDGWYGTAFGQLDISPLDDNSNIFAYERDNSFIVGQFGDKLYGKMHASVDAIACVFKQIDITKNFEFSAKALVSKFNPCKQSGFGVMLRDTIYINQSESTASVETNYIANGFLTTDSSVYIIFSRECTTEQNKGPYVINEYYNTLEEVKYYVKRLGQQVLVKLEYKGVMYEKKYFDFDVAAIDTKYMYLCMYATKGTLVEFSDVDFKITGDAKEA